MSPRSFLSPSILAVAFAISLSHESKSRRLQAFALLRCTRTETAPCLWLDSSRAGFDLLEQVGGNTTPYLVLIPSSTLQRVRPGLSIGASLVFCHERMRTNYDTTHACDPGRRPPPGCVSEPRPQQPRGPSSKCPGGHTMTWVPGCSHPPANAHPCFY